jgi:membrane protein required for colicin V production
MIIDLVVLAVVLVSALISFMRGFIREVLTIAGVVCGIIAAVLFGPSFAPTVRGWFGIEEGAEAPPNLFGLIPMEFVADAVAYGALFLGVVIVVYIITHFISGAAKAIGLGPVDRTLGVVFGIARGLILLGLIYMPLNVLIPPKTKENWFKDSQTHIIIEKVSASMAQYLPDYDAVKQEADDQFKKKLEETDLLAGEKAKKKPQGTTTPAPVENKKPDEEGYREEQRDKLDELFNEPALNE